MTNFTLEGSKTLAKLGKVAGVELVIQRGSWVYVHESPAPRLVDYIRYCGKVVLADEGLERYSFENLTPCPSVFDAEQLLVDAAEKLWPKYNIVYTGKGCRNRTRDNDYFFSIQALYRGDPMPISAGGNNEILVCAPTRHGAIVAMAEELIKQFEEVKT